MCNNFQLTFSFSFSRSLFPVPLSPTELLPGLTILTINNTVSAVSETGTAYYSQALEFNPGFWGGYFLLNFSIFCAGFLFVYLSSFCVLCLMLPVYMDCSFLITPAGFFFFQTLTFIFTYHSSYIYIQGLG